MSILKYFGVCAKKRTALEAGIDLNAETTTVATHHSELGLEVEARSTCRSSSDDSENFLISFICVDSGHY